MLEQNSNKQCLQADMYFTRAKIRRFWLTLFASFVGLILFHWESLHSVMEKSCSFSSLNVHQTPRRAAQWWSICSAVQNLCKYYEKIAVGADHEWHLFYHLGGNGPWIQKVDHVLHNDVDVPTGCSVDQVHMLSRHAERYPTWNAGARRYALFKKPQFRD